MTWQQSETSATGSIFVRMIMDIVGSKESVGQLGILFWCPISSACWLFQWEDLLGQDPKAALTATQATNGWPHSFAKHQNFGM